MRGEASGEEEGKGWGRCASAPPLPPSEIHGGRGERRERLGNVLAEKQNREVWRAAAAGQEHRRWILRCRGVGGEQRCPLSPLLRTKRMLDFTALACTLGVDEVLGEDVEHERAEDLV